jgi:hypothetical protein
LNYCGRLAQIPVNARSERIEHVTEMSNRKPNTTRSYL